MIVHEYEETGFMEVIGGDFQIDGIPVISPTSINQIEHTMSNVSHTFRLKQLKKNLAVFKDFEWRYSVIDANALLNILNILEGKRDTTGSTCFEVSTLWYGEPITLKVEWGSPFTCESYDGISKMFKNVVFKFQEPEGRWIYKGKFSNE